MKSCVLVCSTLLLGWHSVSFGDNSQSCTNPDFADEKPDVQDVVVRLSEVTFTVSANTNPKSIQVTVATQPTTLRVGPQHDGRWFVAASVNQAITAPGRVPVSAIASSTPGCEKRLLYFVEIAQR